MHWQVSDDGRGAGREHDDPVGQVDGLINIVRDEYGREPEFLPQAKERVFQLHTGESVDCGEWLIKDDQAGFPRQGTGDCRPLLHAS